MTESESFLQSTSDSSNKNEKKPSRNLSSFECHEISRLFKHLTKVTSGPVTLSPQKQDTASNALNKLRNRVGHIFTLSIRPAAPETLEVFSLEAFASLEELTLNKCPPSTISDLYSFRKKLTKLEVICSGIPELSRLLAPIKSKYLKSFQPMILNDLPSQMKPLHAWDQLTTLRLVNCGLTRLDASLHYLPALTHLDISYNDLSHIIHLQDCHRLRVLNISHNRISVLSNLIWVIPGIERLNLSHNFIESLDGLGQLFQLQRVDLSVNKINDFHEMLALSELKMLTHLYLLGNAISSKPNYRLHVISHFLNDCSLDGRELPSIDGKMLTPKESYTLRSTIFLPPEIASVNGYTSSRKRLGVLIGDITVYGDEIPIHELDLIFEAEGAKYTEPNSTDDKFSETSSSVVSPSGNRRISVGKQLLRDNPSSAAELLTRVTSPRELLDFSPQRRHPTEALEMLPRDRPAHLVEIIEDDNDITNTLTELCRLGFVSAHNSPSRKSKVNSVSVSVAKGPKAEGSQAPVSVSGSTIEEETPPLLLSPLEEDSAVPVSSSSSTLMRDGNGNDFLPRQQQQSMESSVEEDQDPERLTSGERDTSSDVDPSSLKPIALFDSPRAAAGEEDGVEAGAGAGEREGLLEFEETEPPSQQPPDAAQSSSPLTIAIDSSQASAPVAVERETSPVRKSISGRWSRVKAQQQHLSSSVPASLSPPAPPTAAPSADSLAIPLQRNSESSSLSFQTNPQAGGGGWRVDGDMASLYSSEEPQTSQLSGLKSSSSPMKSHEPEDLSLLPEDLTRSLSRAPIPSYTGSEEFMNLSISDNLQKYFTEQVFGHSRPSGEAPYMRYASLVTGGGAGYVEVPLEPERLVALYREIAIEILPEATAVTLSAENTDNKSSNSSKSKKAAQQQQQRKKASKSSGKAGDEDNTSSAAAGGPVFLSLVFALTDLNLYVIEDNFSNLHKFMDAPIPIVRRVHPMETCRSCTFYFGFQRCALHFFEEPSFCPRPLSPGPISSPSSLSSLSSKPRTMTMTMTYMLITKDKARTHPIITTIPHVANLLREAHVPPLPKVLIANKDSQLLDSLLELIQSLGGGLDTDVVLTQFISQIWKQRPGYAILRTLILTSQRLLLCAERVERVDVQLELVDSVLLKDIHKIRPEDDPRRLTLIMKPQGKMSLVKRKWRLESDSPMIIVKLTDEIRKTIEAASVPAT